MPAVEERRELTLHERYSGFDSADSKSRREMYGPVFCHHRADSRHLSSCPQEVKQSDLAQPIVIIDNREISSTCLGIISKATRFEIGMAVGKKLLDLRRDGVDVLRELIKRKCRPFGRSS